MACGVEFSLAAASALQAILWVLGGTFLFASTLVVVTALFVLDHL